MLDQLIEDFLDFSFDSHQKPEAPAGQKGATDSESDKEDESAHVLPDDFFASITNEAIIKDTTEE